MLVFGIDDDDRDVAVKIKPVALGSELTRLSQITNSHIEPHLSLGFDEVATGDETGTGVIVVSVPSSARKPFAVAEGSRLGYYIRTGRNKQPMSEAEVGRMYADRANRLASVGQRLAAMAERVSVRVEDLVIGARPEDETLEGHPIAFVAIAPVEAFHRLFRPDRETLDAVRAIPTSPVFGIPELGAVLASDLRPGFKRIDIAHGYETAVLKWGWREFHDDGAFVGAIIGRAEFDPPTKMANKTELPGFYDTDLTIRVVAILTAYGVLAKHFDVHGELALRAGFLPNALPAALIASGGRSEPIGAQTLDRTVSTTLSLDSTDLMVPTGVLAAAAPIIDDLVSAFAWPRGPQLESDGTIRLRFWGGSLATIVEQHAEVRGLATHTET